MDDIRKRATEQFPMVLLTLLSIVQALALEFLWDHLRHRTDLYDATWIALLGWMQVSASLTGIILIWLIYSGMVMRFQWTPSTADSVLPFFVGLIEFLLIDLMGPASLGPWLIVLAFVFATMIVVSHKVFRRARQDPANRSWFRQYSPAVFRDFAPHIVIVSVLMLTGAWLWYSGNLGWPAFVALLATHAILAKETYEAAIFWDRSMGIGHTEETTDG